MVVDIGGGTTEVAVLSLRGLAYTTSVRVGGDKMDEAISSYVRRNHNLLIGEATAERIKKQVGVAKPPPNGEDGEIVHIKGRDLVNGVPKEITINQRQIAERCRSRSARSSRACASRSRTRAGTGADIVDQGIVLTGGGALLKGWTKCCATRPACRSRWRTIRSPASRSAPDARWRKRSSAACCRRPDLAGGPADAASS
jgi:rod shape-determining protein MreB